MPWLPGYLSMLDEGRRAQLPAMKEKQTPLEGSLFFSFFSEDFCEQVQTILQSGLYIPQEILNRTHYADYHANDHEDGSEQSDPFRKEGHRVNSDFYRDLEKRMYSIALSGQLFALLKSKGTTLNHYGFERLDQQILLFFMVLRFIMEKTLASEPCFLEDIAMAIREFNRDVFGKDLDQDKCLSLAELCVSNILCNRDEPFFFDPVEGDERWKVRVNYLNSEVVYQNNVPKASYKMSDDGFHLMLSTLEMEENMQLQFRDLVFELQLKAGNYPRALDQIREIFQLFKIQEMEIQNRCVQLRSNAAFLNGRPMKRSTSRPIR